MPRSPLAAALPFLLLLFLDSNAALFFSDGPSCEPLLPSFAKCSAYGYDSALVPNDLGHRTQTEALAGFNTFDRLQRANCSPELEFFLCTLHVPFCAEMDGNAEGIPPCRELCNRVRAGCQRDIARVVRWDDSYGGKLRCNRFPSEKDKNALCMPESPLNAPPPPPTTNEPTIAPTTTAPTTIAPAATTTKATKDVTTTKPQIVSATSSLPKPEKKTDAPAVVNKRKCSKCPRTTRGTYKKFVNGKYDYVIRGDVEKRASIESPGLWSYQFRLLQIYNQSKVDLTGSIQKTLSLWTKSGASRTKCVCPKLKSGGHYLIAGYEDAKNGRLLLNKRTIIESWDGNVELSVVRWFNRAARKFGATKWNAIPPLGGKVGKKSRKIIAGNEQRLN
ncbi:secreted frizzled-related protein 3-like [Oscarella lobularis]|uniref:secreted frizzled-related protein 3-like n=1 Tax=Oscarella lobularis TaxID=121494 RepID=UPI00331404A7